MAVNFDLSQLTPEQWETWEMQQELQRRQENGNRIQMLMQQKIQQQKERFEMLSNALKAIDDSKGDTSADMK